MNNKPKYQRALDWVNRQRATRNLEPRTDWPPNVLRRSPFVHRSCACPVALALGSGWVVYCSRAETPDHEQVDLPQYVQAAVTGFDNEISVPLADA